MRKARCHLRLVLLPLRRVGPGLRLAPRRDAKLQVQVADLMLAVQTLQLDPGYRKAVQVERWEADFAAARACFEAECEALRAQIASLA